MVAAVLSLLVTTMAPAAGDHEQGPPSRLGSCGEVSQEDADRIAAHLFGPWIHDGFGGESTGLRFQIEPIESICDDPDQDDCDPCFQLRVIDSGTHPCWSGVVSGPLDYPGRFETAVGGHFAKFFHDCADHGYFGLSEVFGKDPAEDAPSALQWEAESGTAVFTPDDSDGPADDPPPPSDDPSSPPPPPPPSADDDRVIGPNDVVPLDGAWRGFGREDFGDTIRVTFVNDDQGNLFVGRVYRPAPDSACPPTDAVVWQVTASNPSTGLSTGFVNQYERDVTGCALVSTSEASFRVVDGTTIELGWTEFDPQTGSATGRSHLYDLTRTRVDRVFDSATTEELSSFLWFHWWREATDGFQQATQPAPVALLATERTFADALAAAPLAGDVEGFTVLLRPDDRDYNLALLDELDPRPRAYHVIGGQAALPDSVLPDFDAPVRRFEGPNRFATAAAITAFGWTDADVVLIATGRTFPDALAGGAVANIAGWPVLLVDGGRMPAETDAELRRLDPQTIIVLGGPAAVPATMVQQLRGYADEVVVTAGPNRAETAVAVSRQLFPPGAGSGLRATVVSGDTFEEALMAAPTARFGGGPLFLVQGTHVPDSLIQELRRLDVESVVAVRAEGRLPDEVLRELEDRLG